jgi:cell division protein FtsB
MEQGNLSVMESIIGLIGALTLFFGALGSTAAYLINRMKKLERENEAQRENDLRTLRNERDQLRTRVTDLEEKAKKVPKLEERLDTVLEQLKDVQARLEKTERALEAEQRENEKLRTDNTTHLQRIRELEAILILKDERINTFEWALKVLGVQISEKEQPSSGAVAPVSSAARTEETPSAGETPSDLKKPEEK